MLRRWPEPPRLPRSVQIHVLRRILRSFQPFMVDNKGSPSAIPITGSSLTNEGRQPAIALPPGSSEAARLSMIRPLPQPCVVQSSAYSNASLASLSANYGIDVPVTYKLHHLRIRHVARQHRDALDDCCRIADRSQSLRPRSLRRLSSQADERCRWDAIHSGAQFSKLLRRRCIFVALAVESFGEGVQPRVRRQGV